MKRTHTCGELHEGLIDQPVTLCGWLHRRRDHGALSFFDLRDRSGLAQVVCHAKTNPELHQTVKTLGPEYVLGVVGTIRRRPKGTENPKLASGMVEVQATQIAVLNPSQPPPFEIDDQAEVSDDVRMRWRYVDLRRPSVQAKLALRHRMMHAMRQMLHALGFLDIETPILTKSTPEGARDYLVPSRLNPGRFYALPQSPQLFKQLLMVGGLERYCQFARCFRDEDLRADRQPEFTQLDLEMSFVEEADVLACVEQVVAAAFAEALGVELPVPFPRMTHREAMARHHTDKPDLHSAERPWAFVWITDFPLFDWNEDEHRWEPAHHPFTAPNPEDLPTLQTDPGQVRSRAYDLVLNGVELGSGSIRIHDAALQRDLLRRIGLSDAVIEERFGFLLHALSLGAPPHGGFALGMDRLVALAAGVDSIREVIAFAKTQKAVCPVTEAPSPVSPAQLKDLGLVSVAQGVREGGRAS